MQTNQQPEPLAYGIDGATKVIDGGRTKIYEVINAGDLKAKKLGGRTIILADEMKRYLASLPDYVPKPKSEQAAVSTPLSNPSRSDLAEALDPEKSKAGRPPPRGTPGPLLRIKA